MEELDAIEVEVGRRIRAARAAAGQTQRELGDRIGVTFQQVQKYEGGRSRIAVSTLCRIAEALGVAPASLIGGLLGEPAHDTDALSPHERELVGAYRSLESERQRETLIALVRAAVGVTRG